MSTVPEIILEVPHEGASGKSLEHCIQAHLTVEETLLRRVRWKKGRIEAVLESRTGILRLG